MSHETIVTHHCLGLEFLGKCSYDPNDPTVYFRMGQLLTLVAISLAVYKILTPIIKLRIEAGSLFIKRKICFLPNFSWSAFSILAILAITFVLFANTLPSWHLVIPNNSWPIVWYPIFWEVFAFLTIAFLAWRTINTIRKPATLNGGNFDVFFENIFKIISSGKDEDKFALAEDIRHSLPKLFSTYDGYFYKEKKVEHDVWKNSGKKMNEGISTLELNELVKEDARAQEKLELTKSEQYCFNILGLFSDRPFCEVIATRSPMFLVSFIHHASRQPHRFEMEQILRNIMEISFERKDSILNRENLNNGLREFQIITPSLFKNETLLFLKNPLGFLEYFHFSEVWQVDLYFRLLKTATEHSFKTQNHQTLGNIYNPYISLNQIVNFHYGYDFTKKIQLFEHSRTGLTKMFEFIQRDNYKKIQTFVPKIISPFPAGFKQQKKSIPFEVGFEHYLAKAVFEVLSELSRIKEINLGEELSIRGIVYVLLSDLSAYDKDKQVTNILDEYVKFHIEDRNFSSRWYPPLAKIFLSTFRLNYPDGNDDIYKETRIFVLEKFKKDFHSLYQKDKKFARGLLPYSCSYEPSSKTLSMEPLMDRWGEVQTLKCD